MRRAPLFLGLLIAATTACFGDPITTSPAREPVSTRPLPNQFVWLSGTLAIDENRSDGVVHLNLGDRSIALAGSTELFRRVDGADVTVYGSWVNEETFDALEFQVLGVGGQVAYDGFLVPSETGGYALEMRDGTLREIDNPPAELLEHVWSRLWMTLQPDSNTPASYGLISEASSF